MINNKLIIKTKSKIYPIYFGNRILLSTGKLIKKNIPGVKKICLIYDKNLPNTFVKNLINSLKNYDLKIHKITTSEKNKNLNVASKIIEQLLKDNFTRSSML